LLLFAARIVIVIGVFVLDATAYSRTSPGGLEAELLAIQDALAAGDLAGASARIETALGEYPQAGGLYNLRGVLHARREELVEARKDFARAVRLAPTLSPAWQNLARACQLEADRDASAVTCAQDAWQQVARLLPGDPEAHSALGLFYERGGKFRESLREIEKLPAEAAGQTGTLVLRCADLAGLGRSQEAQSAARTLAARADFTEADFEGAANAFDGPASAEAVVELVNGLDAREAARVDSLRRLAIAYEQLHRPAEARKALERVAVLDPQNTSHLLELARLAQEGRDLEGAIGYLAHARDLAPNDAHINFLFAMIASEMNLPVEAQRSLERALELEPDNPTYLFGMGFVKLSNRNAGAAATYFEKYVKAKPEQEKGHYALGIAYYAAGDYAKAKEEMTRVKNNPATAGGAEYFLGRIARQEEDLSGAEVHLHKSIARLPNFAESHTELARIRMEQGDLQAAGTELKRALTIDPKSFQANSQLLAIYRRTKDGRAEQQAELVKQLDEERSKRAELMLRTIETRP
jgi:tetratricopeptide (TPR) repeat protein